MGFTQIIKVEPNNTVPATAFDNASKIHFDVPTNELHAIRNITLRWKIKESGASNSITVLPATLFADEVRFYQNGGSELSHVIYGDMTHVMSCMYPDSKEQTHTYKKKLGVSDNYNLGDENVIEASGDETFYVRLWDSYWDGKPFYVGDDQKYTRVEVRCRDDTNGIKAAGGGTVQLDSLELLLETEVLHPKELAVAQARVNSGMKYNYVEWVKLEKTSQTLTASTKYKLDISDVLGKCCGVVCLIRPDSYATSSNTIINYKHLGDEDSKIDLENQNGRSIWGGGQAPYAEYVQNQVYNKHWNNEFNNKGALFIPFSKNFKRSLAGDMSQGYLNLDGSTQYITLTPAAAGTACVQTVDLNGAPNDGGYYKLAYKGDITNELAHTANAAAIKAALEALPSFENAKGGNDSLTITASGAATADFTLTFNSVDCEPPNKDLVQLIPTSLADGGVADFSSTSTTVRGKRGWTTSSSITITCYLAMFRQLRHKGGRYRSVEIEQM